MFKCGEIRNHLIFESCDQWDHSNFQNCVIPMINVCFVNDNYYSYYHDQLLCLFIILLTLLIIGYNLSIKIYLVEYC